jgi:HemY protein
MIRVLIFFAVLAAIALGLNWFLDRPGDIDITWQGQDLHTPLLFGVAMVLVASIVLALFWNLFGLFVRLPAILRVSARVRRRTRGFAALTRGMVAVGSGDSRGAKRFSDEASRLLQDDPLALFLKAQAAQLTGDRATAETSFKAMLAIPETRVLGLRGLHMEARRRGDEQAAYRFAEEAQRLAPLPWAGQAVLDHHSSHHDWTASLAAVDRNAEGKIIDKATANRQRAVLKTALALEKADRDPEAALALAREAIRLAPNLVPATVLAGRLLTRLSEIRKAVRVLEAGWRRVPHPDIAQAYLDVRPGDSARDRLLRAHVLAELALENPEGNLTLARAALEARNLELARKTMAPLFAADSPYGRATARACLLMADLEEVAGSPGRAREWLARASRAARDPVWVADGVIADRWAPISPVSGRLDAFVWETPTERLSAPPQAPPSVFAEPDIDDDASPPHIEAKAAAVPAVVPGPTPSEAAVEPEPAPPESPAPVVSIAAPTETPLTVDPPAEAPHRGAGRRAVVFPLSTAPDDPGPDLRGGLRRGQAKAS